MKKNRFIIFAVLVMGIMLLGCGCAEASRVDAFENKEDVRNEVPDANNQELLNLKEQYIVVY